MTITRSYKLPKVGMDCAVGDFAARLASYSQPKGVGQYLRTHVGRVIRYDNGKARRDLGLTFRPLEETVKDTVEDLKRAGQITAK